MSDLDIQSPCIGVCIMNDLSGLCQGCYRTMDEIQQWWDLDSHQKKEVLHKATERETQLFD
jgi:predicted Fe-S protein YdhL (DUF1289 family)